MNDTVPADLLDKAVAEISALRLACAYEAGGLAVHGQYATFPRSRRRHLDAQVEHLHAGARGQAQAVVTTTWKWPDRDLALKSAGARTTLTRSAWEDDLGPRRGTTKDTAALQDLSAALDEIFWLRTLLACEALTLAGHLVLKSFPKSRRTIAETQADRLAACARGDVLVTYAGIAIGSLHGVAREVAIPASLDTATWLATHA